MKDKEKQIEEMASKLNELFIPYIGYTNDFMRLEIAQELLKYYQPKLPEDSVVFSREEYENIYEQAEQTVLANIADGGTSCHWCIEQHEKKASKETAEKILNELYCTPKEQVESRIKDLARFIGVEIKE